MHRKRILISAALIAVVGAPLSGLITAQAVTSVTVNCATLDAALAAAVPNEVITLHANSLCTGSHTLKTGTAVTLQGQAATDGFDGAGTNQILTGKDNGAITIRNLIFKNGKVLGGGGAIHLDTSNTGGVGPTITMNTFLNNRAASGGAVFILNSGVAMPASITHNVFGAPGQGNVAANGGGALFIGISGNETVSDNVFSHNVGRFAGGGALIFNIKSGSIDLERNQVDGNELKGGVGGGVQLASLGTVTVTGNVFKNNIIDAATTDFPQNRGGGLGVESLAAQATTQSHNLFVNNSVGTANFLARASALTGSVQPRQPGNGFDFGGGGEFFGGKVLNSLDDVFNNNRVSNAGIGTGAVGGGFAIQGNSGKKATLVAANMVVTNNSVGTKGEGGGIYAGFIEGCFTPPCTAEVDLFDSTVDGNLVGPTGVGAGMAGDATDVAKVVNSIVYGNTGTAKQVAGFGTISVNHSDSCQAAATAYAGAGNVCVDPLLANVAANDVHETATSPTIDAGDSLQVPAGVTSDYEGDGRVQGARVDLGADEFTPAVPSLPKAGRLPVGNGLPSGLPLLVLVVLTICLSAARVLAGSDRR